MNSAKVALVIASKNSTDQPFSPDRAYHSLVNNIRTTNPPLEGIESIAENVWQIDLSNGLKALSCILEGAIEWKVPVRVLFLDDVPNWSNHPCNEKPAGP
jgi:hypothetical protein